LKKVDVLSGGERARVLLGKLLVSPSNLVMLDEPTNHLDMESIDSLIAALQAFSGGALIVTHNERVLHAVATKLVIFDRGRARSFDGTYQDFLDRVGWGDEDGGKSTKRAPEQPKQGAGASARNSDNKKSASKSQREREQVLRQQRATITAARSKALRPLLQQFSAIEASIVGLEAELEQTNDQLQKAADAGDKDGIVRHSKAAATFQKRIEALFKDLEWITDDHDSRAREFDQQLERLAG
jgi:ATP-binding cassette subfamily F protein 3